MIFHSLLVALLIYLKRGVFKQTSCSCYSLTLLLMCKCLLGLGRMQMRPLSISTMFFLLCANFLCVPSDFNVYLPFSIDLQNNLDFEIGDLNPTSNILVKYFRIFCGPRGKRRHWAVLRSHLTVFSHELTFKFCYQTLSGRV